MKNPPSRLIQRRCSAILKVLLLVHCAAVALALLVGCFIYPSSPLLVPSSRRPPGLDSNTNATTCLRQQCSEGVNAILDLCYCRRRCRAAVASASFVLGTSLRTTTLAPLLRMQGCLHARMILSPLASLIEALTAAAEALERLAHGAWEEAARQSHVLQDDAARRDPPEIDLNTTVPCDRARARAFLLGRQVALGNEACVLREIITRPLLVEFAKVAYGDDFELATHPLVLRNVWPADSAHDGARPGDGGGRLTPAAILRDPRVGNLLLPSFFSDAARTGYAALVPDAVGPVTLAQFVAGVLAETSPRAKIGTQVLVEQLPELRDEFFPPTLARELFGWREDGLESLKRRFGPTMGRWVGKLPSRWSYPVFIASNRPHREGAAAPPGGAAEAPHPRTDLHTEPIGNIASQLWGTRRWTLVPTRWSGLLRPSVSKQRGYFYANLDPLTELPARLGRLPSVYACTTSQGDALWIPPWMWHRVDYNGGRGDASSSAKLSIGASIFHFEPLLYVANFPFFSYLIIPNLVQEVLGFNTE